MSRTLRIFRIKYIMKTVHMSLWSFSAMLLLALSSLALVTHAQETETTPEENYQLLQERASEVRSEETDDAFLESEEIDGVAEDGYAEADDPNLEDDAFVTVTAALTEAQQTRIVNLSANISNRMEAAINRAEQIARRVQERIDVLSAQNINTAGAQAQLEEARFSLEDAHLTITDIDASVSEIAYSESPRDAWVSTKAIYVQTAESITNTFIALKSATNALSELTAQPQEEAELDVQ